MLDEIPDLNSCDSDSDGDDTNGFSTFDLTANEDIILNGSTLNDFGISYFTDAGLTDQISNPSQYINTINAGQTIYFRIFNLLSTNCSTDGSFEIAVDALPEVVPFLLFKNCDEDGIPDGFTDFSLSEVELLITMEDLSDLQFSYHLTISEAESGTEQIDPLIFNNSISNTIYVRTERTNGCFRLTELELQVSTTSFPQGYIEVLESCDYDDDNDGFHVFDLTLAFDQIIQQFPGGQNLIVQFYTNLIDAQLEQNEITDTTNYQNSTAFSELLYVRVESLDNGACFGIGPHLNLIVNPRPEFDADTSSIFCLNGESVELSTFNPQGDYSYEWRDDQGNLIGQEATALISSGGIYSVEAISSEGCSSVPVFFDVVESGIAEISSSDLTVTELSDNNTITIDNSGNNLGLGDYEFALDDVDGPYQDDPFFSQVGAGDHTLFIRDRNGCGIAQIEVFILGFPKFFTPNGDGYNDTWNIKGWSQSYDQSSRIRIFNRYGKLVKELSPAGNGWNGTFNGNNLLASDYWFTAELVSLDGTKRTYRGHFSLVR